ncbi:MAG TPA: AMP-binding protein [Acidimicrobiales bacterium]|nr:AMP-binding protein [Acidimicrobiales bacterium]
MTVGVDVARHGTARPDAPAVFDGDRYLTWGQFHHRTNRLANALAGRYGVGPGDRVALLAHNRLEVAEVLAATAKAGGVYVGLNFRMDAGDLDAAVANADPTVLLAEVDYEADARRLSEQAGLPVAWIDAAGAAAEGPGTRYEALVDEGSDATPATVHRVRHTDLACIVYTSGTTGTPKGVVFDHAAVTQHATVACLEYGIDRTSRYLVQIPHNSSVNITMAPCIAAGAALGFADNRQFDPDRFAAAVADHGVTHTFLVPTQLMRVLDALAAGDPRLASVTTLGYGSSPISPDRLGSLVDRFGPIFLQLYGMAEIASIGTLLRKDDHVRALTDRPALLRSCGQPSYAVDVRVVDGEGADVPVGGRGEVVFAGPHVMRGYHREPARTAEVLVDGWMHSGDVAEVDDEGYVYIVDRLKHLIIRGGQNIAPTEVENVLYRHPAVLEAAVVGAPDPEWGERVVAVVALRDGAATTTPADLAEFVARSGLATIKRPEEVRVLPSLPKNAVGKIDKQRVRAAFWDGGRAV